MTPAFLLGVWDFGALEAEAAFMRAPSESLGHGVEPACWQIVLDTGGVTHCRRKEHLLSDSSGARTLGSSHGVSSRPHLSVSFCVLSLEYITAVRMTLEWQPS